MNTAVSVSADAFTLVPAGRPSLSATLQRGWCAQFAMHNRTQSHELRSLL